MAGSPSSFFHRNSSGQVDPKSTSPPLKGDRPTYQLSNAGKDFLASRKELRIPLHQEMLACERGAAAVSAPAVTAQGLVPEGSPQAAAEAVATADHIAPASGAVRPPLTPKEGGLLAALERLRLAEAARLGLRHREHLIDDEELQELVLQRPGSVAQLKELRWGPKAERGDGEHGWRLNDFFIGHCGESFLRRVRDSGMELGVGAAKAAARAIAAKEQRDRGMREIAAAEAAFTKSAAASNTLRFVLLDGAGITSPLLSFAPDQAGASQMPKLNKHAPSSLAAWREGTAGGSMREVSLHKVPPVQASTVLGHILACAEAGDALSAAEWGRLASEARLGRPDSLPLVVLQEALNNTAGDNPSNSAAAASAARKHLPPDFVPLAHALDAKAREACAPVSSYDLLKIVAAAAALGVSIVPSGGSEGDGAVGGSIVKDEEEDGRFPPAAEAFIAATPAPTAPRGVEWRDPVHLTPLTQMVPSQARRHEAGVAAAPASGGPRGGSNRKKKDDGSVDEEEDPTPPVKRARQQLRFDNP